jgi:hypothetical protein
MSIFLESTMNTIMSDFMSLLQGIRSNPYRPILFMIK